MSRGNRISKYVPPTPKLSKHNLPRLFFLSLTVSLSDSSDKISHGNKNNLGVLMMMMPEHRERVDGGEGHTVMFTVLTAAASPTLTHFYMKTTSANTNFPALKSFLLEFLFFQEWLAGALIPQ